MNKLLCIIAIVFVACNSEPSPETTIEVVDSLSFGLDTASTKHELTNEDIALLQTLQDNFGYLEYREEANDYVYKEPCGLWDASVAIYHEENVEYSGYYLNIAGYRNENYVILEATKNNEEIVLKVVDSNYLYEENEEELHQFYILERLDSSVWKMYQDRIEYANYLTPQHLLETFELIPCSDYEMIMRDFPDEWIDLTKDESGNLVIYEECYYGPGGLLFGPPPPTDCDTCRPYFSNYGGGDEHSNTIDRIRKENDVLYIEYTSWGEKKELVVDYHVAAQYASITYRSNGENYTGYAVPEDDAAQFETVKEECDE